MKLSHQLRFMVGDLCGMLDSASRFLARSDQASHYAKGCLAFALEEGGLFDSAERLGRQAVEADPCDVWGGHAIAHVYEMTGQATAGLRWSVDIKEHSQQCNNFGFHLEWHHALFLLRLGRHQEVLDLYDSDIRPESTDDFRDFSNASSLLVRLEQAGVDVGNRWRELLFHAQQRASNQELVFASLHHLLACLSANDRASSTAIVSNLRALSQETDSDQGQVARQVGLPLADCLFKAFDGKETPTHEVIDLSAKLFKLGGSKVQRDVFIGTLMIWAAKSGCFEIMGQLHDVRHRIPMDQKTLEVVSKWSLG